MNKTSKILYHFLVERRNTMLGVGPMSKNCVDASIEVTDKYNFPIMLIASRRQIDANIFGKGYVENWGTEKFSKYVMSKSKKKNIILCRDHGGPYQNNNDIIIRPKEVFNILEIFNILYYVQTL